VLKEVEIASSKLKTESLQSNRSRDEKEVKDEKMILETSKSITNATSELVSAAIASEKDRVGHRSTLYRRNSEKDLVSAAKIVAQSTQKLVEAANQSTATSSSDEAVADCAKSVASSISQLLSASYSLASNESRTKMSDSAKLVALYTSQLVNTAKTASRLRTEQADIPKEEISEEEESDEEGEEEEGNTTYSSLPSLDSITKTQSKIMHFEQKVKILRLEKDLEKAREDLSRMRQLEYKVWNWN